MLIKAEQKYARISPRKARLVCDEIKKISQAKKAVNVLEFVPKRSAKMLAKVIKTAIANAVNNFSLPEEGLKIKEIQIGDGPVYKRGMPVSRGMFHPIRKRTSHITVILESETKEKSKPPALQANVTGGKKVLYGTKS